MVTIDNTLLKLQELCNGLEAVKRNHYIPKSKNKEDDVLHSYSVAMLAWYIIEKHNLDLNLEKVLKYSMVHDFAEIYAGDTNIFSSKSERVAKEAKEKAFLSQIESELSNFKSLINVARDYDLKNDNESNLYGLLIKYKLGYKVR
ncbi:MAG: HD domain-containing protein [Patescibacteria group bacterium]|jgi:5'-deoxynucleotidase YfbR-like HD superfamily hydrolase|nr:HD domain-containing protein [Patescibacteria group bacterium]